MHAGKYPKVASGLESIPTWFREQNKLKDSQASFVNAKDGSAQKEVKTQNKENVK